MKKKNAHNKPFVIPPSHFKVSKEQLEKLSPDSVAIKHDAKTAPSVKKSLPEENSSEEKQSEEVKVYERPQILGERNAQKVSALSLKSIQKKQELKKELMAQQPLLEELPVEPFSEAEMRKAWETYTREIESQGKFNLHSHLTMGVPKLEENLIHLVFPNDTIKVEVEREKHHLLEYLRSTLKNYEVDLSIEVIESEITRYAYTPREKFDKLKEKNPLIETLRKEFDLDL